MPYTAILPADLLIIGLLALNTVRSHQALEQNSPRLRTVHPPALGRVAGIPQVGGLHHLYQRAA